MLKKVKKISLACVKILFNRSIAITLDIVVVKHSLNEGARERKIKPEYNTTAEIERKKIISKEGEEI